MKITVCELPADPAGLPDAWDDLVRHVADEHTDVVVLPEMPFHRWLAATKDANDADWAEAMRDHDRWLVRLDELTAATVIGSRPVVVNGERRNEAFVRTADGYRAARHKYYLPEEDGFWEATWYGRGEKVFEVAPSPAGPIGMLLCTEVWFTEHARAYGRQGAVIVAAPRATEWESRDTWLTGGRAAAVMSGAFCVSSNRSGVDGSGMRWGGLGWIVDPDGEVLATTSEGSPFATVGVDMLDAEKAKHTYPRYVAE